MLIGQDVEENPAQHTAHVLNDWLEQQPNLQGMIIDLRGVGGNPRVLPRLSPTVFSPITRTAYCHRRFTRSSEQPLTTLARGRRGTLQIFRWLSLSINGPPMAPSP